MAGMASARAGAVGGSVRSASVPRTTMIPCAGLTMRRCGLAAALALALAVSVVGCASYERTRGIDNTWRSATMPEPVVGTTTQAEILDALGPPSQVIGLRDQTVFYYLQEQSKGRGAIFIVYNQVSEKVVYDRAIFFFDAGGVLRDYALSRESIAP